MQQATSKFASKKSSRQELKYPGLWYWFRFDFNKMKRFQTCVSTNNLKWQKHRNFKMVGIFSKQFLSHYHIVHFVPAATIPFKNDNSNLVYWDFFHFSSSIHNGENLNMWENLKFPEARALLGKAEIKVQGVAITRCLTIIWSAVDFCKVNFEKWISTNSICGLFQTLILLAAQTIKIKF